MRWLIGLMLVISLPLSANEQIKKMLNKINCSSHIEPAGAYESQQAGYATAGGIYLRNSISVTKPIHIQLPKYSAGCGGIDAYMGGISLVKAEQLKQALRDLISNSGTYAFMLGMETTLPQVSGTMKQLQSWANMLNSMQLNSCEAGRQIVGGLIPSGTAASEHICSYISHDQGMVSNFLKTKHECTKLSNAKSVISKNKDKDSPYHGSLDLMGDYNLVWLSMDRAGVPEEDIETRELIMNLLGTVIVKDDKVFPVPSLIDLNEDIYKLLHKGNTIQMHLCNKKLKGCIEVEAQELLTTDYNAWFDRIQRLLVSIDSKVMRGEELDSEEIELINRTSIPLFKIINVLSYLHESYGTKSELVSISEFLAMDVLCRYLEDCRLIVRRGARDLMNKSIESGFLKEYVAGLDKAGERIRVLRQEAKNKEQQFLSQLHLYLELDKEMDRKFSL